MWSSDRRWTEPSETVRVIVGSPVNKTVRVIVDNFRRPWSSVNVSKLKPCDGLPTHVPSSNYSILYLCLHTIPIPRFARIKRSVRVRGNLPLLSQKRYVRERASRSSYWSVGENLTFHPGFWTIVQGNHDFFFLNFFSTIILLNWILRFITVFWIIYV